MTNGVFVTGTDTGVGKTLVATALIQSWVQRGMKVAGMKPVASGAEEQAGELRNDDACRLWRCANVVARYDEVNPYVFAPPVAPHLAAAEAGQEITIDVIKNAFCALRSRSERIVVEGVGGWHVPVSERYSMADVAHALALPVLMVVHIRLGCLNHALLTQAAILDRGLSLAGWVANEAAPEAKRVEENIVSLQQRIAAPLVAKLPYQPELEPVSIVGMLDLATLDDALSSTIPKGIAGGANRS